MSSGKPTWTFIIVAAGAGTRLGGIPKQLRLLGGVPLWMHSLFTAEELRREGLIEDIVAVLPKERVDEISGCVDLKMPVKFTEGGAERSDSVLNGLAKSGGSHVLVHDGARPFITKELCLRLMAEAEKSSCAIPVLPLKDSIEQLSNDGIRCVERKNFLRVQTPQAFDKELLKQALENSGEKYSDEAAAWSSNGGKIHHVEGDERNFKITDEFDWQTALSLVESKREIRTGHGYDVHKLTAGRKLILAGVEVENSGVGLLGHSDADIITHTLMDAILGAAGEPDIGTLFPASDKKWKDAISTELLREVAGRVRAQGWKIEWADITLEAQAPRLGHLIGKFTDNLAPFIKEPFDGNNLNLKVKSGEECGSVGRGECMRCHAIATLSRAVLK